MVISTVGLLLISSLFLRFLLEISGQKWIRTISHTTTIVLLPIITFVITKVIAGNIALSLGMVGALSIVRFRNPVRSPLELSVYFASITMGIIATESNRILIKFLIFILFSVLLLLLISYGYRKLFKKQFFVTSFSEGNSLSTLDITASKNIKTLDESPFLKTKRVNKNITNYILASNDFEILRKLTFKIENNDDLIEFQLNE